MLRLESKVRNDAVTVAPFYLVMSEMVLAPQ